MIAAGEYRVAYPLFQYDRWGNVACLVNAGLTDVPALTLQWGCWLRRRYNLREKKTWMNRWNDCAEG